ncbi:MAG: hypothetical protein QOC68_3884 [Solirubrobacteraceae bacterium]|jgi:hypothetical protein|nr:hypothetical protein [Solirubrobacteraceae bacterium]
MASSSKKKTTMAKIMREQAVRERRLRKQAKKDARKLEAANPTVEPVDEAAATGAEVSAAER